MDNQNVTDTKKEKPKEITIDFSDLTFEQTALRVQHPQLKEISEYVPQIKSFRDALRIAPGIKIKPKDYTRAVCNIIQKINQEIGFEFAHSNGIAYIYNEGYWQKITDDQMFELIRYTAIESQVPSQVYDNSDWIISTIKELLAKGRRSTEDPSTETTVINFKDKTLKIEKDGSIKEYNHEKDDFLKYKLSYNYDGQADCPKWKKFLSQVIRKPDSKGRAIFKAEPLPEEIDHETINVIQEYIGYCFSKSFRYEKMLVCTGGGSNGKSVFFNVIEALIGKANMSTLDLASINVSSLRVGMENKLVNFSSEIGNTKDLNFDLVKKIVSGEPILINPKYLQPYETRSYGKLIFNGNSLLQKVEHSTAFFRRFIIVNFLCKIEGENIKYDLTDELKTELPGIMNWAIEGLQRLNKNGFTKSRQIEKTVKDYQAYMDNVHHFLDEFNIYPAPCVIDGKEEDGKEIDPAKDYKMINFDYDKEPLELKRLYIKLSDLISRADTFFFENGYRKISNKELKRRMFENWNFDFVKTREGQRVWVYAEERYFQSSYIVETENPYKKKSTNQEAQTSKDDLPF